MAFRGIITMGGAIFFSFIFIRGIFPSSAGKPREESLILRSLSRSLGFLVYFCMFVLGFFLPIENFSPIYRRDSVCRAFAWVTGDQA